jgi:dephospho-CoA kinase
MKTAMLRINIQPSDDFYKNRSDFIIKSDNDLKTLYEDTIKLIKNITENYNAKCKKDNN